MKVRSLSSVGRDQGHLTREEVKYIEERIIEAVHEQLQGRELFPLVRLSDAGWMFYKYYNQRDMGDASISLYGVAQAQDIPVFPYSEVIIPIIEKDFFLQWRDVLASRHQGPDLLTQVPRNAARQVAEEEDKLLLTGEYTGWAALGIQGLLTAAGNSAAASGNWPANAVADINTGRIALENAGFIDGGNDPVLIGRPAVIKCLDRFVTNTAITYRQAILDGGLVRDIVETRNLFAADGGTDSALLVVPGRDNFWMVEAMPPTTVWWQDKKENYYGTVREAVVPVIARGTSIYEVTDITCA